MRQLDHLCTSNKVKWTDLSYDDVVHEFMQFHNHDDMDMTDDTHVHAVTDTHGTFNTHQLDSLVKEINEIYRPGEMIKDGSGGALDPPSGICSYANITLFRSGDVYERSARTEPAEGVTEEELAAMNSILLFHFLRGDCVREDLRFESKLPEPDDFIVSLFKEFADNKTCLIYEEGFEALLARFGLNAAHDHDHGHSHAEQHDDHDHDHDHAIGIQDPAKMCMGEAEFLRVFGLNASLGLSRDDVQRMSPLLVQQVAQGCQHVDEPPVTARPDPAAVWGYSILSVLIVSAFAPLGLFITRWKHLSLYKYIMSLMLGLGVSSLAGDALLHLVPEALGAHNHGPHAHGHAEEEDGNELWKMFLACCGIWFLFVLQLLLHVASSNKNKDATTTEVSVPSIKDQAHENPALSRSSEDMPSVTTKELRKPSSDVETPQKNGAQKQAGDDRMLDIYADSSLGWMVSIGDCFHNFTDGMAIGASYAVSLNLGLSTTIAIFFHEIPHEFGDVAVMLSAGWTWKQILPMQAFTQSWAVVGLFVGIPVAQIDGATQWILALAVGLFIYVALSNVIPELVEYFKAYDRTKVFFFGNLGIAIGFAVMVIIALFEGSISI